MAKLSVYIHLRQEGRVVWTEGALQDSEAARLTLAPAGATFDHRGLGAVLRFAGRDGSAPPLLVARTDGDGSGLQLGTECQLLLGTVPLRTWRYGVPNAEASCHGKRAIRWLTTEEKSELESVGAGVWHATSLDGALHLRLDAPSAGTPGLVDAWHISAMSVALCSLELYRVSVHE